jgi:hypothetical protein
MIVSPELAAVTAAPMEVYVCPEPTISVALGALALNSGLVFEPDKGGIKTNPRTSIHANVKTKNSLFMLNQSKLLFYLRYILILSYLLFFYSIKTL